MKKLIPEQSVSLADELEERLVNFAVRIIKLSACLPRTPAGKHIAAQILRSGTSPAPTMVKLAVQKVAQISSTKYEWFLKN